MWDNYLSHSPPNHDCNGIVHKHIATKAPKTLPQLPSTSSNTTKKVSKIIKLLL